MDDQFRPIGPGVTVTSDSSSDVVAVPNGARTVRVTATGNAYVKVYYGRPAVIELMCSGGEITDAYIVDGGAGYNETPDGSVEGDGSAGAVTLEVTDGVITDVVIANGGGGYTEAEVVLDPPHTAATNADILVGAYPTFINTNGTGYISLLQETAGAKVNIVPVDR